jgi:FkbM family methyltransferase
MAEHYIENLIKNIDIPHNGFFIEAGANNGITQSYTYELEKLGWRGLLVEPSIKSFEECFKNRSVDNVFYNCALVDNDNIKTIKGDFNGSLMSSINGQRLSKNELVVVEAKTITKILDENNIKDIDLFSLDVEGFELTVLKGLDFSKYKPKYFVIEVYTKEFYEIVNLLLNNGYILKDNLTGYNHKDWPHWDGQHNDYLFQLK